MSKSLTFDNGIPSYDGAPELLDEYLDRMETLGVQYNEELIKKQGPLAPRLCNALKGEVYEAAKAANIANGGACEPCWRQRVGGGVEQRHPMQRADTSGQDLRQVV